MAIDTAEKRRMAAGVPFLGYGITPNASPDEEWRSQSAWSYRQPPLPVGGSGSEHLSPLETTSRLRPHSYRLSPFGNDNRLRPDTTRLTPLPRDDRLRR